MTTHAESAAGQAVCSPSSANSGADHNRLIVLGNDTLTPDAAARVARTGQPVLVHVEVAVDAARRMAEAVEDRDALVAADRPIYGVTTGFGDSGQFHIGKHKAVELQRNMVSYHLNGTGPNAP